MENNIVPQLDKSFFASQIFWFAVSFTFLYFICSVFIVPTIKSIVNKRKFYKKGIEDNTNELLIEANSLKEEYQKQIELIHLDAENLKQSINKKFLDKIRLKQSNIDSELKKIKQEAHSTISEWKNDIFKEEKKNNYCFTFASNILSKIFDSKVNSKELEKYLHIDLNRK